MKDILENPIFINLKSIQLFELICPVCKKGFSLQKKDIKNRIVTRGYQTIYCSNKCQIALRTMNNVQKQCTNCSKELIVYPKEINKNKSGNFFCNHSCAATYNNKNKKFGTKKSKLEIWLQNKLSIQYSELEILYCNKEAIKSELDIYIPSLNLAFELNGIYHYEPIHGQDKLNQVKNNDHRKFQACLENNIELCIIDTSQHKYVKEQTNLKYLDIIKSIIDCKLNLASY